MTTRLNVLFNGSPDGEQTFREVMGAGYSPILFSRFAKWRRASKAADIWTLEIDSLPLDRHKVTYILATERASEGDIEASAKDITESNSIPLRLSGERDFETARRIAIRKDCVELCDRVFVVNTENDIDAESQEIIAFAEEIGRRVVYLNY